jgi:hypothetical protein
MKLMLHDWVLTFVNVDWASRSATLRVIDSTSTARDIYASGLQELTLVRLEPWGPSEAINSVTGPVNDADGIQTLEIEMQSGDVLKLRASKIVLPPD